jgi:hypothetical protein
MNKTVHGTVHGRTIELHEELGIAEGQEVEILVKLIPGRQVWGEGIVRSAGGWVEHGDLDSILEQIHRERQDERRAQVVDP